MIIDTDKMVIKSDDGKMVLNTISSVSITKGANTPVEETIYTEGQIHMAENRSPLYSLKNEITPSAQNEKLEINILSPYSQCYNALSHHSMLLNGLYVVMALEAIIKMESKKSKKLFKSKFYLLKNKSEIKKIKNKLKRHLRKDIRIDWNKCKETTALKMYKVMKGWVKQNGK